MSFNNTQLPVELPVFKDKVMYISSFESSYKMEQSYVVSASYKGILRLSPNNYNTIYEDNPIELTVEQDQSITSSYSDAIVFDDEAIVKDGEETEAKKVNADIRYRMISGSDSDGFLVNFRISDESIEFDKLGVIGITKTKQVTIYSDADYTYREAFQLGNTIMPSLPNELENNTAELKSELESITGNTKQELSQWDEIEVNMTGDGDLSYILSGTLNKDGKREFNYKRTQQFVKDLVLEALLSIKSVPTGSIHWFPVTYTQYQQLVNDGQQYPNHYYRKDLVGNDTSTPSDPMIRDYLLCDGRKYKSEQFPELAKILWGEKIRYWDTKGKINTHINGKPTTEDGKVTYDDYFRVPDLRAKFISYVYAKGAEDALMIEPTKIHTWVDDQYKTNVTGYYTPDNSPKYPSGLSRSPHFHFLAYGSYNGYNLYTGRRNDLYHFKGWKFSEDLSAKDFSPRIWYLQNTVGDHSSGDLGWAYGFGSANDRGRSCSSNEIAPANAYVSAPAGGHSSHTVEPSLGSTSYSKTLYTIPTSNADTYKVTKYEDITTDYIELENNIKKGEKFDITSRYGYENAPKFYAFLPLIKI